MTSDPYLLSRPRDRWTRIAWRFPGASPTELDAALAAVDQIPGVDVGVQPREGFADFHESTYALDPVHAFFRFCGKVPQARVFEMTGYWRWTDAARSLYEHQQSAWRWLVQTRGGILADDMGLGKTATAACAMDSIATAPGDDGPRLIVGPLFVRDTWRRELDRLGLLQGPDDFAALSGRDDSSTDFVKARWWFCHWDVIPYWHSRINFNPRGRPRVVAFDEAHHARNPRAKRTKGAMMVGGTIPARIVLTGTPLVNKPADLWTLLTLVDGPRAWGSPSAFRERYCGATRDDYGLHDGFPTNVEELTQRLEGRYLRREATSAGVKLPPLTRSVLTTPMRGLDVDAHKAQLHGFPVAVPTLVEMLMSGALSDEVLRALTELRRVTSHAKIPTTVEYVTSAIEQGASIVVFVHERKTAELLAQRIDRVAGDLFQGTNVVHGGLPIAMRDSIVRGFQDDASGRPCVIVATYGALREGVTLTRARIVLLHDLTWVPSDILQAEKRVHRIGSTVAVQSIWCVAENSIDTIFARILESKAESQHAVLDLGDATRALAETGLLAAAGMRTIEEEVARLFGAWR